MTIALATLVSGYALLCVLVFLFQARLIYFPTHDRATDPSALGLVFEDLALVTADGTRIHGWYLPLEEARGAVLVCHGNAGNLSHRLSFVRAFQAMGFAVLLFDYRGYGQSSGRPSEAGLYDDTVTAYGALTARGWDPTQVVVYGESLGAGEAIELATRVPVAGVVVESAFSSMRDMARELYPWLPTGLLLRHRYDNAAKLRSLDVPVLIVHSPEDELVPCEHAARLEAAAGGPVERLDTRGGHNDGGFLLEPAWCARVEEWCLDAVGHR